MCLFVGMCMQGQAPAEAELELQVLGIKLRPLEEQCLLFTVNHLSSPSMPL